MRHVSASVGMGAGFRPGARAHGATKAIWRKRGNVIARGRKLPAKRSARAAFSLQAETRGRRCAKTDNVYCKCRTGNGHFSISRRGAFLPSIFFVPIFTLLESAAREIMCCTRGVQSPRQLPKDKARDSHPKGLPTA